VDKGWALREMCKRLDISTDEVVAFGDAENDIGLLQVAGLGICMANGASSCKAVANIVSQFSNEEDAVARELEKIFHVPASINTEQS